MSDKKFYTYRNYLIDFILKNATTKTDRLYLSGLGTHRLLQLKHSIDLKKVIIDNI